MNARRTRLRRQLRWFVETWPKGWRFWLCATLGIAASLGILHERWGVPRDVRQPVLVFPVGTALLILGYFGFYRALQFHPGTSKRYREWLVHTPYSVERLPQGPLLIAWRDGVFVITISFLLLGSEWVPLYAGVLLSLWIPGHDGLHLLYRLGMYRAAWLIGIALAASVAFMNRPLLSSALLVGVYAPSASTIRTSIRPDVLTGISTRAESAFRSLRTIGLRGEQMKTAAQRRQRVEYARSINPANREANLLPFDYGLEVGWPLAIFGSCEH